jgi:acyl-coenzyme A synthetase/AMP-(fatty) acid ligase
MKEYFADLTSDDPVKTLRNDDGLAVTANGIEITYKEFNIRIKQVATRLAAAGITDINRVLVVGDNNDMISTIVAAWGVKYLGASSTNGSGVQSKKEIDLKFRSADADAILWVETDTLDIITDLTKVKKLHPEEKYLYFTSGTTRKDGNLYTTEAGYFTYPEGITTGTGIIDDIIVADAVLGEYTQINLITTHGWEIAYTPHNLCKCLLTGGTFHWTEHEEDVPLVHAKYKSNMMSTYPVHIDRLADFDFEPPIPFIEVSGGALTNALVQKIRTSMKPHTVSNTFSASGSGVLFINLITDESTDCEWLVQPPNTQLTIKLDENNQLWMCRNGAWRTDNDLFEEKDGKYRYIGRSNDDFLVSGGGKVSTWEVEDYVHAIVTPEHNNAGNVYVFPMNGLDGCDRHGLIYSGSLEIEKVQEVLADIIKYKQPQKIFQVTDNFWSLYTKVVRSKMSERITEHRECVLTSIEKKRKKKGKK